MTDRDDHHVFEDATHRLDLFRGRLRERQEALRRLEHLRVDHTSSDGLVSLTLNADGLLTDLRLASAANGLSAEQISAAVMRAYGAAQREAAQRSAAILEPAYGPDSPVLEKFRRRQTLDRESAVESSPQKPPTTSEHEDDDFDAPSTYRA